MRQTEIIFEAVEGIPASEGNNVRTGFVDFVTSDNPHCGSCTHVCFDIDERAYVCRRFGVEVHEQSYCDDWLHERTPRT